MNEQYFTNLSFNTQGRASKGSSAKESMSLIAIKKQNFHKQIRKEQLNDYFKAKRAVLIENIRHPTSLTTDVFSDKGKTILECFKSIRKRQKIELNLSALINILALPRPFQLFIQGTKYPQIEQIDQFCVELINLMFSQTLPEFQTQKKSRILCLTALSNLFADPCCQNYRFLKKVLDFIDMRYGDVQIWGYDEEINEVFYVLGNLARKRIVHGDFITIQRLLGWLQSGIQLLASDSLRLITDAFDKIFQDIDDCYNYKNGRSHFTDHFRYYRQLIIQRLLKRFLQTTHKQSLQKKGNFSLDTPTIQMILMLFKRNKPYLLKCIVEWEQDEEQKRNTRYFITKIIVLLNQQTLARKAIKQIGAFFIDILKYFTGLDKLPQTQHTLLSKEQYQRDSYLNNQSSQLKHDQLTLINSGVSIVHKYLLANCLEQIFKAVCFQCIQVKIIHLKVIYQLLENSGHSLGFTSKQQLYDAFSIILVEKNLQHVLLDLIQEMSSKLRDLELLRCILDIYQLVIKAGQGRLGLKIYESLSHFHCNDDKTSQELSKTIEQLLNLHHECINQENSCLQIQKA